MAMGTAIMAAMALMRRMSWFCRTLVRASADSSAVSTSSVSVPHPFGDLGALILAGLLTRLATLPMIVNMLGALLITKLPILWGDAPLFDGKSGW
ncbi:hypothetical protein [Streptomyces sp. UG1]|uniref:hypothetical protein n=1 Tax=Streptomyces sp. UG1 TaxID=3417652 RepID=UPI003CF03CA4